MHWHLEIDRYDWMGGALYSLGVQMNPWAGNCITHKFCSHASGKSENTTVSLLLKNCPCREQGSNYL